jgi:hypothetical protein
VVRVVDGFRQRLAVAAKIVVWTVAALVANTLDGLLATITHDFRMSRFIDVDFDLTREGNVCKAVAFVLLLCLRETLCAQVIVGTLEALETGAADSSSADVTGC